MERWKKDFIHMIGNGRSPEEAARLSIGWPLGTVHAERVTDPDFRDAWDEASPGADSMETIVQDRTITPALLERLLKAQVDDQKLAAYFGMSEEALHGCISLDADMKRVYETARDAGLAELQMAQWEGAMSGKVPMQQWMGKQHLDQADKSETKNKNENIHEGVSDEEVARRLLSLLAADEAAGGTDHSFALDRILPVIDVETEVVAQEEEGE